VSGAPARAGETYAWSWQGRTVRVAWEIRGDGPAEVIALPAFSTVSTRTELHPLADRFAAAGLRCVLLDRAGFGASDRLDLPYGPALHRAFLADFVATRPAREPSPAAMLPATRLRSRAFSPVASARWCWWHRPGADPCRP
jgi:alpha-beta hydrolase superfamily lysophospholipase